MNCKIIRSERRSFSIQIIEDEIIVRAPLWAKDKQISDFLKQHDNWINQHYAEEQRRIETARCNILTENDLKALKEQAKILIPQRVEHFAHLLGVNYGNITIRNQLTRWGSCSSEGNLNFNVMLMLVPPEVLDSVVVHELCHRKEMNHSKWFYSYVYSLCPEYKNCYKWLKINGPLLLRRLKESLNQIKTLSKENCN